MSSTQDDKVLPGCASEEPRPGRSKAISLRSRSRRPAPKATDPLIAEPAQNRTGRPLAGPHSYQARRRPSRRRIVMCRSAA